MWRLLVPLVFLACNSGTNSPETKKASFNLKEACTKSEFYLVTDTPTSWNATVGWLGRDSLYHTDQVEVQLTSKGFVLPCGYGTEADPKPVFTITWD